MADIETQLTPSGQPVSFQVISSGPLQVRQSHVSESPQVSELQPGVVFRATHRRGSNLKLSAPVRGWVTEKTDADGLAVIQGDELGCALFRYRIVSQNGAFVRATSELNSQHLRTLPKGAIVTVVERQMVRVDSGGRSALIPRLRITDELSGVPSGWISEIFNPLSQERGNIAEALPMFTPLRYRVTYDTGAIVRGGLELNSPVVRVVPLHGTIIIDAKTFTDSPPSRNVQRLRLQDGSGWVSLRLNRPPPGDTEILIAEGAAPTVAAGGGSGSAAAASPSSVSPVVASTSSSSSTAGGAGGASGTGAAPGVARLPSTGTSSLPTGATQGEDISCVICLDSVRNACFVHGDTGHIACCYECGVGMMAARQGCPICRAPIDKVIKTFWS